jgi:cellulose synthase/poly-beta-1,6-N-acetylglucosamine synthase-like glycosyltransferase
MQNIGFGILYTWNALYLILGVISLVNLLFVIITFLLSANRNKNHISYRKKISVIIPVYNTSRIIKRCLKGVFLSGYNNNLEIICVNDGSTDDTLEILQSISKKHSNLKIFSVPHGGKAHALNYGVKKAKYDFVVVLDADMYIEKGSIEKLTAAMRDPSVGYSFGVVNIDIQNKLNPLEYFQSIEFNYMNLMRIITSNVFHYPVWFSGQYVCYRKDVLRKVSMFDPKLLIEDFDISARLFDSGYKSAFVNNAESRTLPMTTFGSLISQRMRWYYGGLQTVNKNYLISIKKFSYLHYVNFSYLLWFANSLIMFPAIIYSSSVTIAHGKPEQIFVTLLNNTFAGVYVFYYAISQGLNMNIGYIIYRSIGSLIFLTILISILTIDRKFNITTYVHVFCYFIYILFLQGCLLLSLIYYPLKKVLYSNNN